MKFKKIQLYILFTFLSILILPNILFASPILQQLVSDTVMTRLINSGFYPTQPIGNGYNEIPTTISVYLGTNGTAKNGTRAYLDAYEDEALTIPDYGWWCYSDFIDIGTSQPKTLYSFEDFIYAYEDEHTQGSPCEAMNPDLYYVVKIWAGVDFVGTTNTSYAGNIYGSASDTIGYSVINPYDSLANYYLDFEDNIPPDNSTRIDTVTPYNEEMTATSTTFSVGSTGHINAETYEEDTTVDIKIWNNAYNSSQLAIVSMYDSAELPVNKNFSFNISTGGNYSVSTTTNIQQIGLYYMTTKINHPLFSFWGFDIGTQTIVSTTTSFTVATTTQYDVFSQEVNESINNLLTSSSQFTCEFDFTSLFSFDEMKECVAFLFVPNFQVINEEISGVKSDILIKFPIGYVTDLANIFSNNTATSSLPVLSATLPSALGIGSPTIELSFSHIFDFILDADGGNFTTSTTTFYETTSYYWKIFVYLMTFFYLLGRIIKRFSINLNYI